MMFYVHIESHACTCAHYTAVRERALELCSLPSSHTPNTSETKNGLLAVSNWFGCCRGVHTTTTGLTGRQFMVWGWDVDLEAPLHISELNSAIAFLSLKNGIALWFSSEMCRDDSSPHLIPRPWVDCGNKEPGWWCECVGRQMAALYKHTKEPIGLPSGHALVGCPVLILD